MTLRLGSGRSLPTPSGSPETRPACSSVAPGPALRASPPPYPTSLPRGCPQAPPRGFPLHLFWSPAWNIFCLHCLPADSSQPSFLPSLASDPHHMAPSPELDSLPDFPDLLLHPLFRSPQSCPTLTPVPETQRPFPLPVSSLWVVISYSRTFSLLFYPLDCRFTFAKQMYSVQNRNKRPTAFLCLFLGRLILGHITP